MIEVGEAPPGGEPDEPTGRAAEDRTPPALPKDAIWKSVVGATGGFGCERETLYRELVRDERGYRLRFGADEPVVFGASVDVMHGYLIGHRMSNGPIDVTTIGTDISEEGYGEPVIEEMVRGLAVDAVTAGVLSARSRDTSEPWTDDDWQLLADRTGLAAEKMLGLWPNRLKERKVRGESVWDPLPEPDGTPPGPPVAWLDMDGLVIVPQKKMHAPGVVGGRGVTGQPDYVLTRDGIIVGWVDVKALSRAGQYPGKWAAGEAVTYDYLCTVENGGVLPEWHAYMEYRRVQKPYWAFIKADVSPGVMALAESYFRRWGIALNLGDPDAVSFNVRACGRCHYREPIPGLHPGCPIGQPALDIAPSEDDDAG